jgi:hypothetical protein
MGHEVGDRPGAGPGSIWNRRVKADRGTGEEINPGRRHSWQRTRSRQNHQQRTAVPRMAGSTTGRTIYRSQIPNRPVAMTNLKGKVGWTRAIPDLPGL